jgi:CubicO group peptidase (beta-lactamase class C family)
MRMTAEEYEAFPWNALFDPIGMASAVWERDLAGNFIGATALFATPRDFARFGLLYLNGGNWGDQIIIPQEWVAWSTHLPPAVGDKDRSNYSAWWWLNADVPEQKQDRPWPQAPADTFAAQGYQGQAIIIIPSLDLVVVRTGAEKDGSVRISDYLDDIVASVQPVVSLQSGENR